jgi:hypothetical protein
MSISFQSKSDKVLSVALKVQELCVKKADAVVSVSGSNVIIDLGEEVEEVRAAIHCKDGEASPKLVSQASIAFPDEAVIEDPLVPGGTRTSKGKRVTLTLSAAMATADSVVIKYVLHE